MHPTSHRPCKKPHASHLDVDEEGRHGDRGDDESGEGHEDRGCPLGGHKGVALCGTGQGGDQVGSLGLRGQIGRDAIIRSSCVCILLRTLLLERFEKPRSKSPTIGFGFGGAEREIPAPSEPNPYGSAISSRIPLEL